MQRLINQLRIAVPAMFDSDEYRTRGEHIDAEFAELHDQYSVLCRKRRLRTASLYCVRPLVFLSRRRFSRRGKKRVWQWVIEATQDDADLEAIH
jgi:hypothetical protein